MIGKQTLNNFRELFGPFIQNWWRIRQSKKQDQDARVYTRWEQDNDLTEVTEMALFEEYLEMVIQYGFITLFCVAFPLAPLFALMNNVIEVRLDAYKWISQMQRPLAIRAQDIGVWSTILRALSNIAVVFNAFIISYTSDFIPKLVYLFAYSSNRTLDGYVSHSLSLFNTSDYHNDTRPHSGFNDKGIEENVTQCFFRGYLKGPEQGDERYKHTLEYWHIFAARLAFVVVFEHCVFFLTKLVVIITPDVPAAVKIQMQREKYLATEALYATELEKAKVMRAHEYDPARQTPTLDAMPPTDEYGAPYGPYPAQY